MEIFVLDNEYDIYYNFNLPVKLSITPTRDMDQNILNFGNSFDIENNCISFALAEALIPIFSTPTTVNNEKITINSSSYSTSSNDDGSSICTPSNKTSNCLSMCENYTQEILSHLFEIEKNRKIIDFKSPQICYRDIFVKLIKKSAKIMNLHKSTVYLAAYLMDVFMDNYKIVNHKIYLLAPVCLMLASKIEERDINIPRISNLNALIGNNYTKRDFISLEKKIICAFDFNILHPTIINFLEIYSNQIYTMEDYNEKNNKNDNINNYDYNNLTFINYETDSSYYMNYLKIQDLLMEYADIILEDHSLSHQAPSLMAATCIAASRITMKIHSIWPNRLKLLTKYDFNDIDAYVDFLICRRNKILGIENYFSNDLTNTKNTFTPDSGYLSSSPSSSSSSSISILSSSSYYDDDVIQPPTKKRRLL